MKNQDVQNENDKSLSNPKQGPVEYSEKVRPYMGWLLQNFFIENVPLTDLLQKSSTPFYVTSLSAVEDRVRAYRDSLKKHFPCGRVYYALKANWGIPIIDTVRSLGEGFDIVSGGELSHLLSLGVEPSMICFAGVGKTNFEIESALRAGVGVLNIEHLKELEQTLLLMKKIPTPTRIALRLNPSLEIETHPHLRTGALDSKFGILAETLVSYFVQNQGLKSELSALGKPLLECISGIHVHVGSQLLSGIVFNKLVAAVADLAETLGREELRISHLDFGGGLGVPLKGVPDNNSDVSLHIDCLHQALKASCSKSLFLKQMWGENFEYVEICLEPGRSIVASSTFFATEVLYTRVNSAEHRFAFVDGGMNDFPRPSIYGAAHDVVVGFSARERPGLGSLIEPHVVGGVGLQIVGPVCESGDVLRKDAPLETVAPGDVILFLEAGAYCRSMASEYNLRKLPQTFYVRGNDVMS